MRFYPYSSRVFPLNHEKSQEEPEEEEHCRKNCDRNQDPLAALFLLLGGHALGGLGSSTAPIRMRFWLRRILRRKEAMSAFPAPIGGSSEHLREDIPPSHSLRQPDIGITAIRTFHS